MSSKLRMAAALMAFLFALFTLPDAQARELTLNNRHKSLSLYAIFRYVDQHTGKWTTNGWFRVEANSSRKLDLPVIGGMMYYYAHSYDEPGKYMAWAGDPKVALDVLVGVSDDKVFVQGQEPPTGDSVRNVRFKHFKIKPGPLSITFQ